MESTKVMERKWEDLNRDCLVEILARAGTTSVAMSIPFVCKSWYDATLDPRCWKSIVFPDGLCSCSDDFLEFVVGRSQRSATSMVFPGYTKVSDKALLHMAEGCPMLKVLHLPSLTSSYASVIPDLIGKLKNLEFLAVYDSRSISKIMESINVHCKNFYGLKFDGSQIFGETALSIVQFTPKIKHLAMTTSHCVSRSVLITILKGCRELELLDVGYCIGFEANDVEILNLASHIKSFNCTGTVYTKDEYDIDDYYNPSFDYSEYFYDADYY